MSNFTAIVGIGKNENLHPDVKEFLEEKDNFGFRPNRLEIGLEATIDGKDTKILADFKLTIVELFSDAPLTLEELLKKNQKHYIIVRV